MDQNSGCDCFVLKLKLKTEIWGMVKHLYQPEWTCGFIQSICLESELA